MNIRQIRNVVETDKVKVLRTDPDGAPARMAFSEDGETESLQGGEGGSTQSSDSTLDDTGRKQTKNNFSARHAERNAMGEYVVPKNGRPLTQLAIAGPSPWSYSPRVGLTKHSAPQYSLVGKPNAAKDPEAPGPNKYDTRRDIVWSWRRTKTLGQKGRPEDHGTVSPSPACYNVTYYATGKHAPKYKLGSRHKARQFVGPPSNAIQPVDTHGFKTPGPNYVPKAKHYCKGQEKSFGLKHKEPAPPSTPGPGAYNVSLTGDRGPKYSLAKRICTVTETNVPGPGTYDIPSTIGTAVAKSISGRYTPLPLSPTPSPNAYHIRKDTNKMRFSLTYRTFETPAPDTPGPAHYQPSTQYLSTHKNSPKCHCGQKSKLNSLGLLVSQEHGMMRNSAVGPGTYDVKTRNDSSAYSMGKRISTQSDWITPGPGHYNVSATSGRSHNRKAPTFSIGRRLNHKLETTGPGPAACYVHPKVSGAPSHSMAGRPRHRQAFQTPSPNSYAIQQGQTTRGWYTGPQASLKGRASPYVYSGFSDPQRVGSNEF